jgi:hypothetical protein
MIDEEEDTYLNWFYDWTYNQSGITSEAREEYIKQYSKLGGLRAGVEYYKQFLKMHNKTKNMPEKLLDMLILTIGGEAGLGKLTTTSFQKV